jgi:hypothetical protein
MNGMCRYIPEAGQASPPANNRSMTATGSRLATLLLLAVMSDACSASISTFAMGTFRPPDASFSVTVPNAAMHEQTRPGAGAFTGATVHFWLGGIEGGPGLAVVYAERPAADTRTPDAVLSDAVVGAVGTDELIDRHPVTVHGVAGVEVRVAKADHQTLTRAFAIGRRLYTAAVSGSPTQVTSASAVLFLDSFEAAP